MTTYVPTNQKLANMTTNKHFNTYKEGLDLEFLREYCMEHGEWRTFERCETLEEAGGGGKAYPHPPSIVNGATYFLPDEKSEKTVFTQPFDVLIRLYSRK